MVMSALAILGGGIIIGIGASFTGLGGGFLMVPFLLFLGFLAQKAVGTSFLGILIIALTALVAYHKLDNVDYQYGLLLGLGGLVGTQIGPQLVEQVSVETYSRKSLPSFSYAWLSILVVKK